MLNFIMRLLRFSGKYAWRIKLSFLFSFLDSMLFNVPVFISLSIFVQALNNTLNFTHAVIYGIVILSSLIIRCVFRRIFVALESGAGYEICERERLSTGN